jgi:hypothetical protein
MSDDDRLCVPLSYLARVISISQNYNEKLASEKWGL